MTVKKATLLQKLRKKVGEKRSESGERNAVASVLAGYGYFGRPRVETGRDAGGATVRVYVWDDTPWGGIALISGPSIEGEVKSLADIEVGSPVGAAEAGLYVQGVDGGMPKGATAAMERAAARVAARAAREGESLPAPRTRAKPARKKPAKRKTTRARKPAGPTPDQLFSQGFRAGQNEIIMDPSVTITTWRSRNRAFASAQDRNWIDGFKASIDVFRVRNTVLARRAEDLGLVAGEVLSPEAIQAGVTYEEFAPMRSRVQRRIGRGRTASFQRGRGLSMRRPSMEPEEIEIEEDVAVMAPEPEPEGSLVNDPAFQALMASSIAAAIQGLSPEDRAALRRE